MVSSLQDAGNTKNFWALEMIDASAKPGPSILRGNSKFMGNYQQCAKISRQDPSWILTEIRGHMLNITQVYMMCPADLDISEDTAAIVAIVILSIFGLLAVVGTFMDLYVRFKKSDKTPYAVMDISAKNGTVNSGFETQETKLNGNLENSNSQMTEQTAKVTINPLSEPQLITPGLNGNLQTNGEIAWTTKTSLPDFRNHHVNGSMKNVDSTQGKGENTGTQPKKVDDTDGLRVWQKALLAFSVPRNTGRILSTRAGHGNIGCLHGIRVLSLAWVILGHVIMTLGFGGTFVNTLDVFALETTLPFQLILNAPLAVDTFFFMSGFLTAYLFMKECGPKMMVKGKTMILYYVHRYWRLTPPMMIWLMIVATLIQYIGEGRPAWNDYQTAQSCRDNWWVNLLYINSVYPDALGCIGVTWFLSNDMMYYIIAPLVLVPLVYRLRAMGLLMAILLIGIHLGCNIWLIVKYNFDLIRRQPEYSDKLYFKPYTRVAPFAIGLIFGYILYKAKGKVQMNKVVVVLGWLVAIGLTATITLVTYDENNDMATIMEGWPMAGRLIHETFSRPVWALIIGWIVLACSSGYGGFLPLSRLSYGAYLVHLTIINFEVQARQDNTIFTIDLLIYHYFGFYVMSYAVGYLLSVFVEMPLLGLERAVLKR
ncbi:nose resistant to fluoxetine protein 6-like [Aplysia californica]|uniref:Nose resistant to fluoxetine protein 6-like n=1 Tax=Aplysia californica TaxID=6500 RepID=A0ABM0JUF0_APLCA|nr:nose resistant to fluoxetine protein 6-like [Aplysia californica]